MGFFKTKEEKQKIVEAKFKRFLEESDQYKKHFLKLKRGSIVVYLYSTLEDGEILIHYKTPRCTKDFHKVVKASDWSWDFNGNFKDERVAWLQHRRDLEALGIEIKLNKV